MQIINLTILAPSTQWIADHLTKPIEELGCHIEKSQMAMLGDEYGGFFSISGHWSNIAKLESILENLKQHKNIVLHFHRANAVTVGANRMPYVIQATAGNQHGVVTGLLHFLANRDIPIYHLTNYNYSAPFSKAKLFFIEMLVGIDVESNLSELRDDFLEICETLNIDAIIDPEKS